MVLFQKDFQEQGVIPDLSTKNLSFMKMAILLNKMGVKNNMFFLALHDRELAGIDPHDLKDNSIELKQRIMLEAKINPWYFYREIVRIAAAGTNGIKYVLNRANLALMWVFYNSINSFLVIPRQIGKSVTSMSIALQYLYVMGFNVNWGMFCKGNKLQTENVDRLKKLRDALPKWMLHPTPSDTNNKEGIYYADLKNGLITFVAQSDKRAAGDQARGQSFAVEYWDEVAYYDNIHLSYSSATAGMDAAGDSVKRQGLPSAIIMTTTAGELNDPRGRWCYNTACDAMRFTEKLYDCYDRTELWNIVQTNSKNNYLYLEYSYQQVGKDRQWFDEKTRNKPAKVVAKDYLNQWLAGTEGSIFPPEVLEKIRTSKRDPVTITTYEGIVTKWYDDPQKLMNEPALRNKPYVIGSDTSDNVGRDFTTLVMVDPYDLHPVCTFAVNSTNLHFVATYIMKILNDFPRAIFIPERNKNGAFMLDYVFAHMIRDRFNPLTRIYNKFFQEYTPDDDLGSLNYSDGAVRQKFGFSTTAGSGSRSMLYSSVLSSAIELAGERLYDAKLIDEISGLTTKNGRVDHTEQGHDDLLIAYLLACYFILYASNHNLYGIRPDEFLAEIKQHGEKIDQEEKKQILAAQRRLAEYKSRVKNCSNPVVKATYEREIQKLIAMVGDTPIEENNGIRPLDQVKQEALQERRQQSGVRLNTLMQFF